MTSCACELTLYRSNDQVITVVGLQSYSGTLIPDAAVLGTLFDSSGVAVVGFNGVQFISDVVNPGNYLAVINGSVFNPPASDGYKLRVTATTRYSSLQIVVPTVVEARELCVCDSDAAISVAVTEGKPYGIPRAGSGVQGARGAVARRIAGTAAAYKR